MSTKAESAVIREAQSILEDETNAAAEEQEMLKQVEEVRARKRQAHEELRRILEPVQNKRLELLVKRADIDKELERLRSKARRLREDRETVTKEIAGIEATVERANIPRVLLGSPPRSETLAALRARREAPDGVFHKTQLKPYMVGEFTPVAVSVPVKGSPDKKAVYVIEGDGVLFRAARFEPDEDIPNPADVEFTVESTRLSNIATKGTGWASVKDIAWGIVKALDKTDKFPDIKPVSDRKSIEVLALEG